MHHQQTLKTNQEKETQTGNNDKMKPGIISYAKAYQICEEGLRIKKRATSAELLDWLINHYNIHSLNITPKGITNHLKLQGYKKYKRYKTKPYIFIYEKENN